MLLRDIKETLEQSLQIGYESLIPMQKDIDFIKEMEEIFIKILDNVMFYLSKEGVDVNKITYKNAIEVNKKIRDTKIGIKEIIQPQLKYLSSIISKRFNIPTKIKLDANSSVVTHSIYSIHEPKLINQYMNNISNIEKDLSKMLISGKTDTDMYKRLNSLKNIANSIMNNKFDIDFKTLKVKGLDKNDFIIYLNLTNALINKMDAMTLVTCIIKEVARYFSMLNKLYKTHKVSLVYYNDIKNIDSNSIDGLKIALENRLNTTTSNNPNDVVVVVKEYLLRYDRDIREAIENRHDEEMIEKDFISAFNLTIYYTKCITADNTIVRTNTIYKVIASTTLISMIIIVIKLITTMVLTLSWIVISLLTIISAILIPHFIALIFILIINTISLLAYIFKLNLTTKDIDFNRVKEELVNYKKSLIRRLRTDGIDRDERLILIDGIKSIEGVIDITNNNISILSNIISYAKKNDIDLIDSLKDNDLHYLSEAIKTQGVK